VTNTAPTFDTEPELVINIQETETLVYYFSGISEPDYGQGYEVTGEGPGFVSSFDAVSYTLSPEVGQAGSYTLSVTITDDYQSPGVSTYAIQITVEELPEVLESDFNGIDHNKDEDV
jgi:hypothetical protein